MYGLSISLKSIQFNRKIVRKNDKIRVTISAIPNKSTDSYLFDCSKIHKIDHTFNVNITDKTKKILFIFEKKSFFQSSPIIASTYINSTEIPKSLLDLQNTELKTISVYEPISIYQDNQHHSLKNEYRQIFGQITFQLSVTDVSSSAKPKLSEIINNKIRSAQGYSKVKPHGKGSKNNLNCDFVFN